MALTSAQIVTLACQIAKAPGYTYQAGQFLNVILGRLARIYDFDTARVTYNFTISPQYSAYSMPADYLRAREVFYNVNGEIFFLNQIPLEDYDQLFQGPGISNYPVEFATDVSTNPVTMYFYNPPAQSLDVTLRYQPLPADITNPEGSSVVPWFPEQDELITLLSARLMKITEDSREAQYDKEAQALLSKYLIMSDDKEGYARTVKLDRRSFPGARSLSPTKQQPL